MADNIKKSNNTSTKDKVNEIINKILYGLFVAFILAICTYFLYVIAPEIFKFIMDYVVIIIKKDYPILKSN
jgi:hypothetical protein